jgi:hypothetical protein
MTRETHHKLRKFHVKVGVNNRVLLFDLKLLLRLKIKIARKLNRKNLSQFTGKWMLRNKCEREKVWNANCIFLS